MKRLWHALSGVLGENSSYEPCIHTAEDFAIFFMDKVDSVCASTAATPVYNVLYKVMPMLTTCTNVTIDEVQKLMGSAAE